MSNYDIQRDIEDLKSQMLLLTEIVANLNEKIKELQKGVVR